LAYSLGELAERFGCDLHGDPACRIRAVAPLARAGDGEISFLNNPRFRAQLAGTRAAAVILAPQYRAECPVNALVTDRPYVVYAQVAQLLHPGPALVSGIHPTAVIGNGCSIDASSSIGACTVIGDGVRIAGDVGVGAGCVIGDRVEIGAGSRLSANVTIHHDVLIGRRARIQSGVVIGEDGFGYANEGGAWIRIPQLGRVLIGDDVGIGANTTIDRGALGDTVIEEGVKLDNQIQIAHNVRIGAHTAIAGCTGIAGSTTIGKRCAIGGGVGISGHLEIADDVQITGTTFVSQSIRNKGSYSSGVPFEPTPAWRRNFIRMKQLDDAARRIAELERLVGNLQDRTNQR
jgi:UDP-3-O-[3-hydroxymyristoyl] glucosamine N-acyltransferase